MIKSLRIHNLMLVDDAEISFASGFNVLTGETGAGKSAILTALSLVLGARADSQSLRAGSDRGAVEVVFDVDRWEDVRDLLREAGVEHDSQEDLVIRRELRRGGKTRSYINGQLTHLVILQRLGHQLVHHVGAFASQALKSLDSHRGILDSFADIGSSLQSFQESWQRCQELQSELDQLLSSEAERLREIDTLRHNLNELDSSAIQEGEEESLGLESQRLSHAESISQGLDQLLMMLSGGENSILSRLASQRSTMERLQMDDPSLKDCAEAYESAFLELQELDRSFEGQRGQVHYDPQRLGEVEDRLALITQLKRKYGADLEAFAEGCRQRLEELEGTDFRIEELQASLKEAESACDQVAQALTQEREKAAQKLSKAMAKELRSLNMPRASFPIELRRIGRTALGDDEVEFKLSPNPGEPIIAVREHASGGELARVLLAIKTLLAGKEDYPTLIFDELDANIGGQTAVVVGEKLRGISTQHQILCITHFPQLAEQGDHHLAISKGQQGRRTISTVKVVTGEEREAELERMRGSSHTLA